MVCVTTGILRRLDADELEGVLSHELSHVAHRDVMVMTIAGFLGIVAGLVMRWGLYFGGGRRDSNGGPAFIVIWLGSIVVFIISFLLTRVLSRYRELCADRSGAYLTGRPSALASALVKISGDMARIPTRDLREAQPFNAFFFAPAFNGQSISALFATHPRSTAGSSSCRRSPPTCPAPLPKAPPGAKRLPRRQPGQVEIPARCVRMLPKPTSNSILAHLELWERSAYDGCTARGRIAAWVS